MNPYGQFFGVPQQYYGAIPSNYQSFLSTGLVGYAPVAAPPPSVPVTQPATTQASTTEASVTQVVVTQEKTPVTTVFVGNIPERAPDSLVKSLLMRCGNILSWKRVQGASGKLQAFGFCEYQDPESTMRCVRLLNGFEILEKKLMVKVDPKTEDLLNEYRKKKRKEGEDGNLGSTEAEVDDETKKDDDVVKTALQNILQEAVDTYQLGHESPNRNEYLEGPRHLTLDDMDIDGERKDLINKEIETFRRRNEKEAPSEERGKRSRELDYYTSRYSSRNLSRSDRDSERGSRYSRSRSRSREPPKKRPRGGITSSTLISEKHYRSSQIDEEEEAIKKRLERKLKEKEESYQNRLRQWECRERKKHAEYEREKEREKKKQEEIRAEAKNLLDFFITYDDDVEDSKFYKGSAFQRRLTDREIEETADERDRQKELEVFESSSRKLIEEADPNAESLILQMEQAMQEHLQKRLNLNAQTPIDQTRSRSSSKSRNVSPAPQSVAGFVEAPMVISAGFKPVSPDDVSRTSDNATPKDVSGSEPSRKDSSTFLFSMSSKSTENVLKPAAAFADEEVETKSKRPALSWLPPSSDKATTSVSGFVFPDLKAVANLPISEKRAIIKQIIERIPTSREELFAYPIDWKAVDAEFVKERIKPWVDKKIITYLGEAEATLSNFICEQVLEHKPPGKILADVALVRIGFFSSISVLEEEAEVFVVKMWRLLIYVIAEKNLGLTRMRIRQIARMMGSVFRYVRERFDRPSSPAYSFLPDNIASRRFGFKKFVNQLLLYRGLFVQHAPPLLCLFLTCLIASLPLSAWKESCVFTVILITLLVLALVYFIESFFTFAPNVPGGSRFFTEMPQFPAWRIVKLTVPPTGSGCNVVLKCFLILQEDLTKRAVAPTVLFLHGNAGNIGHRLPIAKMLYDACGANVFLLEYRGFGYSTGQPNEYGMHSDAMAAFDYLASGAEGDVDGRNIFIFGRSLGGAVAIDLSTRPGVAMRARGTILENTFTSIAGMSQTISCNAIGPLGKYCTPTFLIHNRFESLKKLRTRNAIGGMKFLFISGTKDELVPPTMMMQLASAWAASSGRQDSETSWIFDNPQKFLTGGREGIVCFTEGNHGTTWVCEGYSDVVRHFISLHSTSGGTTD
ncbi:unnamed protein product [Hydatigera taeniaeformis]|uniref:PWI domain-containing protein n=1 Tax=Hydatigena taeniaeformis TaxID=6205 RepID=A0A0R3X7U7_HYDTA|nr:unnamed protein product [Hydatigera taeniaeformis]